MLGERQPSLAGLDVQFVDPSMIFGERGALNDLFRIWLLVYLELHGWFVVSACRGSANLTNPDGWEELWRVLSLPVCLRLLELAGMLVQFVHSMPPTLRQQT